MRNTRSLALNPFYLRGDFDGDGKADIAVLVRKKDSGKAWNRVCHGDKKEVLVVGAWTIIGDGGDDSWMDAWQVESKGACPSARPCGRAVQTHRRGYACG